LLAGSIKDVGQAVPAAHQSFAIVGRHSLRYKFVQFNKLERPEHARTDEIAAA
jgi:hypothetical protein